MNSVSETLEFGKLVRLFEPAGKIRIIAMVDPFTQWILSPLSVWISAILKQLPNDGKYNQDAPLVALWKRVHKTGTKKRFLGSCDMSSATDRLPVLLQGALLSGILGTHFADLWVKMLTHRTYY